MKCKSRRSAFHETLESLAAARMTELSKCLRFDLADALARDGKFLSHFFQRVIRLLTDAEAHAQHLFFARRQRRQYFAGLLLQIDVHHRIRGCDNALVFDKISQVTIFFLADRCLERNRLLGDLQNLAHLVERNFHFGRDLFRRRLAPDLLDQVA